MADISIAKTTVADIAQFFNKFNTVEAAEAFYDEHEDDISGIVKVAVKDPTAENIRAKFRNELNCPMRIRLALRIAAGIDRINRASTRRPAKVHSRVPAYHD